MTKFTALTVLAVLATTPCFAQTVGGEAHSRTGGDTRASFAVEDGDTTVRPQTRHTGPRSLALVDQRTGDPLAMSVEDASNWADTVCGGDSILYFDYHEDGSVDESSYNFDCMDEL